MSLRAPPHSAQGREVGSGSQEAHRETQDTGNLQNYPLAFLRGDNGHAVTQLWETTINHCQRSNSHALSFKIIIGTINLCFK